MDKAFETKLNILLSELLNEKLGMQSIAETRRGGGRQPDVLIFIGGVKIVLEGSYTQRDAESDVNKKIEEDYGDIGIALYYKEQIPDTNEIEVRARLAKSKFGVKIVAKEDISHTLLAYLENKKIRSIPLTKWEEIDILELSFLLRNIYDFLVKEEFITNATNEIEIKTKDFVDKLKVIDKSKTIAEKLYDVYYKLQGLHYGDYKKISELIYAQAYLTLLLSTTFYQAVQATIGLDGLSRLKSRFGVKGGLSRAYEDIYHIDYTPIYSLAIQVIEYTPPELLNSVFDLGVKLGSNTTLLKKDFSGKVYHKVVGDWQTRKGFATYFTTIPASYILSYLSVFSEFSPMKNTDDIKICDFACGSGTLLNAAYSSLEDMYILENFEKGAIDLTSFHKNTLENNLWGFDALRYAVQIASLNLVFQNPSIALDNMNFYAMPLGKDKKSNIVLGSLKYLNTSSLEPYFDDDYLGQKGSAVDKGKKQNRLPRFSLIIMNPPFTRATGRGGKSGSSLFGFIIDETIRKQVVDEFSKTRENVKKALVQAIGKHSDVFNSETHTGIGPAGEGLLFMYLASQNLDEKGKIAFVLPKSLLTGVSWFLIRAYLLEKFHIEYIVVSYDKNNGYNFSESTSLSEVLIVAQKKKENKEPTKFVCLLKKPVTSFETKELSKLITKNNDYTEFGLTSAIMHFISKKDMASNIDNWGRFIAFPSSQLNSYVYDLNNGLIKGHEIKMIRLNKLAEVGVDRHQFRDNFKETNAPGAYPSVIGGEEENRSRLIVEPNAKISPNGKKGKEMFEWFSSNLLIPDRIRVNTAHYLALYSTRPTMSNIFYSVKLLKKTKEQEKYKALCLWLNSVWGMLTILSSREETEGGWIGLKLSHWRLLPVLDVSTLGSKTLTKLEKIFDSHSSNRLKRLTNQFDVNEPDSARKNLDMDVADALDIKITEEELDELYRLIHEAFTAWI
ncbi:MAG: hypothetical protein M0Z77_04455 [Thermoplasmatales archaeon]|nr:hypothetical protein [Thermoplasmatales archaeon]